MGFSIILILGVAAYIIYSNDQKKGGTEESPLEILKKRYARGEIALAEFEQIKRDLE